MRKITFPLIIISIAIFLLTWTLTPKFGDTSSHREAPILSNDPLADNTDLYAFVSPDDTTKVTFISCVVPFVEPSGGPNFHRFGDDVLYEIHIDNNADAVADISYQFEFTTTVGNPNTFLYNVGQVTSLDDADLNVKQTYKVTQVKGGTPTVLGTGIQVPPANIGESGHPSGPPPSTPNYETNLMKPAIKDLGNGRKVFAGPTDDPFFVDLGAIFDLLTIRPGAPGNAGGGKDALAGYNVMSIALQVPKSDVKGTSNIIGVWSTTSRKATTVITSDGKRTGSGNWVQVSRLGMPLVNEVVVPLAFKDYWNGSFPKDDAQFLSAVEDPEPPKLLNLLYGISVPPKPRSDIVAVFLTGVSGLNQPAGVKASEQLRLNMSIAPSASPNRLGVIAGDNGGFPNGRRLADDVVDVALRVVAGVLVSGFNISPNNALGDGVDKNDKAFSSTFPYLAKPNDGYSNTHGSVTAISQRTPKTGVDSYALSQNYPNPFNPTTEIRYQLEKSGRITLRIFDITGREVRTLIDGTAGAGEYVTRWDGRDSKGNIVASGTYFYRLETDNFVQARKMLLIK